MGTNGALKCLIEILHGILGPLKSFGRSWPWSFIMLHYAQKYIFDMVIIISVYFIIGVVFALQKGDREGNVSEIIGRKGRIRRKLKM